LRNADLRYADLCHADLRNADLCHADLRNADLCHADLRYADLCHADLRSADLCHADLRSADLRYADLRNADLDFSVFPLWCGSFNIKDDGRLVKQLLGHIARMEITDKKLQAWVKRIPKKYVNDICKRHAVEKL
jgi:hypothetical protein